MTKYCQKIVITALVSLVSAAASAQTVAPLALSKTILLPGVVGGFDHLAMDLSGDVLFAAAKDNHTVEAVDLKTGKIIQTIKGLEKPHGLAWIPETNSLYVADGKLARLNVYQGTPLHISGTLKLSDDADDMVYDRQNNMLYVGHGGSDAANPGRVAVVNTKGFTLAANVHVAAHPEALDLDEQRQRVFANIADAAQVAVINTKTNAVEAIWKLKNASDNTPLAFDAKDQVLFIACRKPAVLLALDGNSGREIGRLPATGDADDLFYDASLHRVYVIAGAGAIDVYSIDAARHLSSLGTVHTVKGAKTGLFVPSQNILYVGIPGTMGKSARIRVYGTNSSHAK